MACESLVVCMHVLPCYAPHTSCTLQLCVLPNPPFSLRFFFLCFFSSSFPSFFFFGKLQQQTMPSSPNNLQLATSFELLMMAKWQHLCRCYCYHLHEHQKNKTTKNPPSSTMARGPLVSFFFTTPGLSPVLGSTPKVFT